MAFKPSLCSLSPISRLRSGSCLPGQPHYSPLLKSIPFSFLFGILYPIPVWLYAVFMHYLHIAPFCGRLLEITGDCGQLEPLGGGSNTCAGLDPQTLSNSPKVPFPPPIFLPLIHTP